MLNPFYASACMWSIVLMLYALEWSDLNISLTIDASSIVLNVVIFFIVGYITRKKFSFNKSSITIVRIGYGFDALNLLLTFVVFSYIGHIPLLNYLTGTGGYEDFLDNFKNFSIIPVVLSIECTICFSFLVIEYFSNRSSLAILRSLIYLIYPVLSLQRGAICILLYIFVVCWFVLGDKTLKHKLFVVFMIFFVGSYIFGGLGNIRSGSEWSDSSYIYNWIVQ